jgi:RHS repeat-associated protein
VRIVIPQGGSGRNPVSGAASLNVVINEVTIFQTIPQSRRYLYDADGRLTNDGQFAYSYEVRGQLIGIQGTNANGLTVNKSWTITPEGLRGSETDNLTGQTRYFANDGADPYFEFSVSNGSVTPLLRHFNGAGADNHIGFFEYTNGVPQFRWCLSQGPSSVSQVLDTKGNVLDDRTYTAWGEDQLAPTRTSANPFGFAGARQDSETGLYYNRARMYDPRFGRFDSSDPIGMADGPNTFVYARNSPVTDRDPLGLEDDEWSIEQSDKAKMTGVADSWQSTATTGSRFVRYHRGFHVTSDNLMLGVDLDVVLGWLTFETLARHLGEASKIKPELASVIGNYQYWADAFWARITEQHRAWRAAHAPQAWDAADYRLRHQMEFRMLEDDQRQQQFLESIRQLHDISYAVGSLGGGNPSLGPQIVELPMRITGRTIILENGNSVAPNVMKNAQGVRLARSQQTAQLSQQAAEKGINLSGEPGPGIKLTHLEGLQRLANQTGAKIVVACSRQAGTSYHTGRPFNETSDLDIFVIGDHAAHTRVAEADPGKVIGWKTDLLGLYPSENEVPGGFLRSYIIVSPQTIK